MVASRYSHLVERDGLFRASMCPHLGGLLLVDRDLKFANGAEAPFVELVDIGCFVVADAAAGAPRFVKDDPHDFPHVEVRCVPWPMARGKRRRVTPRAGACRIAGIKTDAEFITLLQAAWAQWRVP